MAYLAGPNAGCGPMGMPWGGAMPNGWYGMPTMPPNGMPTMPPNGMPTMPWGGWAPQQQQQFMQMGYYGPQMASAQQQAPGYTGTTQYQYLQPPTQPTQPTQPMTGPYPGMSALPYPAPATTTPTAPAAPSSEPTPAPANHTEKHGRYVPPGPDRGLMGRTGVGHASSGGKGAGKANGKGGKGRMSFSVLDGVRGAVCMKNEFGVCDGQGCREEHLPPAKEGVVFEVVPKSTLSLVQQKWEDSQVYGGYSVVRAWQIRNPRLEQKYQATEHNMRLKYHSTPDELFGWHGTAETNIISIATNGFDPTRRCGQVFGTGEYFAKDPMVSVGYCKGDSFMFLCSLLLGRESVDHRWVPEQKYYVMIQDGYAMQALPLFVVQFEKRDTPLLKHLTSIESQAGKERGEELKRQQQGGLCPEAARPEAGMTAESTAYLWIGWLHPEMLTWPDKRIAEDVEAFIQLEIDMVSPERNGSRVGAFVKLTSPIGREAFSNLASRKYRGEYSISVDDAQLDNPSRSCQECPRWKGPAKFCRGWNIRGHRAWRWGCAFSHPPSLRPTHNATFTLTPLERAKYDEIYGQFMASAPFHNGMPRVLAIHRVRNAALQNQYMKRRSFLKAKQGFLIEKDLWHGTNCNALNEILTHGLQPPSDTTPGDRCPQSGGKGLSTTLCGKDCKECTAPHTWGRCHMYGLGIYLADMSQKSHRYVREPMCTSYGMVHKMLVCKVNLGSPYLIDSNLTKPDAFHDTCWSDNPTDKLEEPHEWDLQGHDSYYVKGGQTMRSGLGVLNNEYIVFQPWLVLPMYVVEYVLE